MNHESSLFSLPVSKRCHAVKGMRSILGVLTCCPAFVLLLAQSDKNSIALKQKATESNTNDLAPVWKFPIESVCLR